ncbi:hypothetical protein [Scopulibacillus cellulosilyticus]|uniref:Phage protein n=1 Tax=Scopulibacillus cellulosilyticus TaxID=2665665 RepID=A0ABW2PWI8_9BACL
MRINYKVNESLITAEEKVNHEDIEFIIKIKNDEALKKLHDVREFFESDKIYTDVLFYTHGNHTYQVIVRQDSYVAFILGLFKFQLIEQVEWK